MSDDAAAKFPGLEIARMTSAELARDVAALVGEGCCSTCHGGGWASDFYQCSDCLGTGHTHAPESGCGAAEEMR